jgi:hypothetical protein
MKHFDVWIEGYRATGQSAGASYLGSAEANTFEEACDKVAESTWAKEYYDPKYHTVWGCRMFPTEAEARQSFG